MDGEVVDAIVACDAYVWIDGMTYRENNDTATFIETTADGCEILHRLDLSIEALDTSVISYRKIKPRPATLQPPFLFLPAVLEGVLVLWLD